MAELDARDNLGGVGSGEIRYKVRSSWVLRVTLVSLGTLAGTVLARAQVWQGWDTAVILFLPPLFAGLSDPALWVRSPLWKRREALLTSVFGFAGVLLSFFQTPWYYVIPTLTVGLLTCVVWAFRRWETTLHAKAGFPSTAVGLKLVALSMQVFAAGAILVAISFGLFTGLFVQPLDVTYITAGSLSLVVAIVLVLVSLTMFIYGVSRLWQQRGTTNAVFVRTILVSRLLLAAGYALLFALALVGLASFFSRSVVLSPILADLSFVLFLVATVPFLLAAVLPAVTLSLGKARTVAWLGAGLGLASVAVAMASVLYVPPVLLYPPWGPSAVWVSAWFVAAASALLLSWSYRRITPASIAATSSDR